MADCLVDSRHLLAQTKDLIKMNHETRHVVVPGGAGGIGRAVARRFAQAGCTVHLLGRNLSTLTQAASDIASETGATVMPVLCDLEQAASIAQAFASLPGIDVLVNAAGSITRKSLHETLPEDWSGSWSGKVLGTIETSRLACDRMRQTGGGVIVNVIGVSGVRLNPKSIMTTTANAALIAFTEALGSQSVDWNIRVVGINPGLTATPRTEELAAGRGGDAYKAALKDMPFQRMAKVQEIAECTWFLASESAQYISGTVIDIDGGSRWRS
jgi:NAD(P)-dependent dehydrogenase (short-subunit alcohol dehydrogenase family)